MPIPPLVDPVPALSPQERERTARHARLAGFGDEGQRRLAAARVAVIGAGGLGSPVVLALAAAGVGELVVVDDDTVDLSNLQRQVIHRRQDVGAPKADSAVRVAAELSDTRVRCVTERLTAQTAADRLRGVDLVIDGTDTFDSREIIAAACDTLRVPLVWGTVQEYAGQVTVFWSAPPAPHEPIGLHDLYPAGSDAPSCSAIGVLGSVCLQIGAVMATEAIKLLCGIGRPLLGRVMLVDALAGTAREVPLHPARVRPAAASRPRPRIAVPEVDDPGEDYALDVREADELLSGTVPDVHHLPLRALLSDVPAAIADGHLDAGRVVVVCQVGARARVAARALREAGVDAVVLRGGMNGWTERQGARA